MNRPGTVLVFALLAVLAMELLAMSAFGFARIAGLGALHEQEHAVLESAVQDALARAIVAIDAHPAAQHPVGTTWSIAIDASAARSAQVSATAERLSARLLRVGAEASNGRGARVRAAALLRILPVAEIMAGFPAVITTALPPGPVGLVEGTDTTQCAPAAGLPVAVPAWITRAWADSLPFGSAAGISWGDLDALAAGLSPVAADSVRVLLVSGDTTLETEFHGMLISPGDVRLTASARVHGIVVAGGALVVENGARVHGAVRALVLQDEGGTFRYAPCAIADALASPAFRRVYRPAARWRVPAF